MLILQGYFLTFKVATKVKGRGHEKIHANFIVQMFSLGGVETQNSVFNFFNSLILVVKYAAKLCQNFHSNGFFYFAYYVTS